MRWTDTPGRLTAKYGQVTASDLQANRREVGTAGRIVSLRLMGKAGFARLQGPGRRMHIDELSIWVEETSFLTKALLPLAEKWHGLTQVESRYRKRYLDLLANEKDRDR